MPVSLPPKSATAFRTIGEVSKTLDVPQHILRYWETRFPQVTPLQRAGNRRYYRPADVVLLERIKDLLERQGYSIRGVQQILSEEVGVSTLPSVPEPKTDLSREPATRDALIDIRQLLMAALDPIVAARF